MVRMPSFYIMIITILMLLLLLSLLAMLHLSFPTMALVLAVARGPSPPGNQHVRFVHVGGCQNHGPFGYPKY